MPELEDIDDVESGKHYMVDGKYVGCLLIGEEPEGAVEVPLAPEDASEQWWERGHWQWPTKHYVDADGKFIGSYAGPKPPEGQAVPEAPAHAGMRWKNGEWVASAKLAAHIAAELEDAAKQNEEAERALNWDDE